MKNQAGEFKIEIHAWKNEELGLWYVENRAFDERDTMVEAFLDVCDNNGTQICLGDLEESNRGKNPLDDDYTEVTVEDIEWTYVEELYDGYSEDINDRFINASDYLSSKRKTA